MRIGKSKIRRTRGGGVAAQCFFDLVNGRVGLLDVVVREALAEFSFVIVVLSTRWFGPCREWGKAREAATERGNHDDDRTGKEVRVVSAGREFEQERRGARKGGKRSQSPRAG